MTTLARTSRLQLSSNQADKCCSTSTVLRKIVRSVESSTSLHSNEIRSESGSEASLDEENVVASCVGGRRNLAIRCGIDAGGIHHLTCTLSARNIEMRQYKARTIVTESQALIPRNSTNLQRMYEGLLRLQRMDE